MTREELFQILRPIVVNVTGVAQVILANQSTKAPTGEYCTIEPFSNLTQLGRGHLKRENIPAVDGDSNFEDLGETLTVSMEAVMSVNFYRGNAQDYAQKLMFCDQRSAVSEYLFENVVGWMGCDPVNNLTMLNSGQYEQRSQMNIRVRFKQEQTDSIQAIYEASWIAEDENANELASGSVEL
jgi:hypothetical protein